MPFLIGSVALFIVIAIGLGIAVGWLFFGGRSVSFDDGPSFLAQVGEAGNESNEANEAQALLRQRDGELESALARLGNLASDAEFRADELDVARIVREELADALADRELEIDTLQRQLAARPSEMQTGDLRAMERLRAESQVLAGQLRETELELESAREHLQTMAESNGNLNGATTGTGHAHAFAELESEVSTLRDQLLGRDRQTAAYQNELGRLRAELGELRAMTPSVTPQRLADLERVEAELTSRESELRAFEAEFGRLRSDLANARARAEAAETTAQRAQESASRAEGASEQLEALRNAYEFLRSETERVSSMSGTRVAQAEAEMARLQAELTVVKAQYEEQLALLGLELRDARFRHDAVQT